jgi:hypothetical protein
MARVDGWPALLSQYILHAQDEYTKHGFKPGMFDCCTYVADWVEVLTGEDPIADYRGEYQDLEVGFDLLKEREGTLYRGLVNRFGKPVHPAHAQRGDIAYRKKERMLGIIFTSGAKIRGLFLGEGGMSLYAARDIDYAFRVK